MLKLVYYKQVNDFVSELNKEYRFIGQLLYNVCFNY